MRNQGRNNEILTLAGFIFSGLFLTLILVFCFEPEILRAASSQLLNSTVSTIVLVQGIFVLRAIWRFEKRAAPGSIPFSWCVFGMQHLAFGLGGFLVSVFNNDYTYVTDFGVFPFTDIVVPFLVIHGVAMNVALLGTWLALFGNRRGADAYEVASGTRWSWNEIRALCLGMLVMHGLIAIVLVNLNGWDRVKYVGLTLQPCVNATYLLWGLTWRVCKARIVFISYTAAFVLLYMILGSRGMFASALLMFAIGYVVSGAYKVWTIRGLVKWTPMVLFMLWACVASEDVRTTFTRGVLIDVDDTVSRVQALGSADAGRAGEDAAGLRMTPVFRIGSRLFELSGAAVVAQTPSEVPFWGWSQDDTKLLSGGFLPKLSSGNAAAAYDDMGVLFLHTYGFSWVDPEKGTSMPATLVGDAWRRFGWAGVFTAFLVWSWLLAKVTQMLGAGRRSLGKALFGCVLLSTYLTSYDTEITGLILPLPRRILVAAAYSMLMMGLLRILRGPKSSPLFSQNSLAPSYPPRFHSLP